DHRDPGARRVARDATLDLDRAHAQARAVAGGNPLSEAFGHETDQVLEIDRRAQVLVHVQVDRSPELVRHAETYLQVPDGIGVEVRRPTDHVHAQLQRRA